MKEKDVHKIVRDNKSNDNDILANALKAELPQPSSRSVGGKKPSRRMPLGAMLAAIFAPVAATVTVLAVCLPMVLTGENKPTGDDLDSSRPPVVDYVASTLDHTVKEYNELYGTDFLYFEGQPIVEQYVVKYSSKADGAFYGLKVGCKDVATDSDVEYAICSRTAPRYYLEFDFTQCTETAEAADIAVKWTAKGGNVYGVFDHGGHDYCITIDNERNENRLIELVELLLASRDRS